MRRLAGSGGAASGGPVRACTMLAVIAAVAACAGGRGATGEPGGFRVFYPDAAATGFHAKVGKRFYIKPVADCRYDNGHDARWSITGARVEAGKLPPGLAIEDGAIGGVPINAGEWGLTIKFSGPTCAGKTYDAITVDVRIVVAGPRATK